MTRRRIVVALVLLLLVGGGALSQADSPRGTGTGTVGGTGAPGGSGAAQREATPQGAGVRVVGDVRGLVPGVPVATLVRVTRTAAGPAVLHGVRATWSDPSAACPLKVTGWSSEAGRRLARGATVEVPVTVELLETGRDQDVCRSATWPLRWVVTVASA